MSTGNPYYGAPGYPPPAAPQPRRSNRLVLILALVAAVLLVVVIGVVVFVLTRDDKVTARYEAADSAGPMPFTAPVTLAGGRPAAATVPQAGGQNAEAAISVPSRACDAQALKAKLAAAPEAAAAWAEVLDLQVGEIDGYIDGLHSETLMVPVQVTNHDYESGEPRALQSVLDAGTAVLVDEQGVPRVRCECGNPLLPAGAKAEAVTGAPDGFDMGSVQQVAASAALTVVNANDYRTTRGGYSWIAADREILCHANASSAPSCYLAEAGFRPPFTEQGQCSAYQMDPYATPHNSRVLAFMPQDGPCHMILQGHPGNIENGKWSTDNQGNPVKSLPDNSAIVVPSDQGDVRCVTQGEMFSCRVVATGVGYTVSPTIATFDA